MIKKIHLDPKLEKCLASLKKGSRRACLAADRIETIIAELKGGQTPPGALCAYTRNGEARIKGCLKFNLGAGYRLVTLKRDRDLYLLFAGTHDDCARWIENNRDQLDLETIAERSRMVRRAPVQATADLPAADAPLDDAADEEWRPPVDDRNLRLIFSGLVNGR